MFKKLMLKLGYIPVKDAEKQYKKILADYGKLSQKYYHACKEIENHTGNQRMKHVHG